MTKLTYRVGTFETDIYKEAVSIAEKTHFKIERIYTPIEERPLTTEEKERAAKRAAILAKRAHWAPSRIKKERG